MLSLFNRFLSRIRSSHPIFSNKDMLVVILGYLDGDDLFQVFQVSFLLKTTIESVPSLQITLLRFRMKKSNKCIIKLKSAENPNQPPQIANPRPYQRAFLPLFPYSQIKKPKELKPEQKKPIPEIDLKDEKWVSFVNYFKDYAKNKGFKIMKKKEFRNEEDWKKYESEYMDFYKGYVDHIKQGRLNNIHQERAGFKTVIYDKYSKIMKKINFTFHKATNYRFFPTRSERNCRPSDPPILF